MSECPYFIYKKQTGEALADVKQKFSGVIKDISEINEEEMKLSPMYGACEKGIFYPIKNSDTLNKICQKFGISMGDLLSANPYLNPNRYIIGQIIIIPTNVAEEEVFIGEYELGEMESLADVLRRFDMCVIRLRQLNPGLDIFNLKGKDKVRIDTPPLCADKSDTFLYAIQAGEDLNAICAKFGASMIELFKANPNLRPHEFKQGQNIYVPIEYNKKNDSFAGWGKNQKY